METKIINSADISSYSRQLWMGAFTWFLCLAPSLCPAAGKAKSSCQILKVNRYFSGKQIFQKGPYFIEINEGKIVVISKEMPKKKACPLKDLKGLTLLPGLIDAHTHLFLEDKTYGKNFSGELRRLQDQGLHRRQELGEENAKSMLFHGFTTVRDLGNSGQFLDETLKKREKRGKVLSPRLFISGPALAVGFGQFNQGTPLSRVQREYTILKSEKQIAQEIRRLKAHNVDWVKVYADNDPNPETMPSSWLKEVAKQARLVGLPLAVHATSGESVDKVIRVEAKSLEHGYEMEWQDLKEMARHKIFLIPTDYNSQVCRIIHKHNPDPYYDCRSYAHRRKDRLLNAKKAGVPIAFGSDMYLALEDHGLDRGAATLTSLMALVEHGLSAPEAIRAATLMNGKLLQREDLGVIEVGARADFAAFRGVPLEKIEDLRNVAFVMKDGKEICGREKTCGTGKNEVGSKKRK